MCAESRALRDAISISIGHRDAVSLPGAGARPESGSMRRTIPVHRDLGTDKRQRHAGSRAMGQLYNGTAGNIQRSSASPAGTCDTTAWHDLAGGSSTEPAQRLRPRASVAHEHGHAGPAHQSAAPHQRTRHPAHALAPLDRGLGHSLLVRGSVVSSR